VPPTIALNTESIEPIPKAGLAERDTDTFGLLTVTFTTPVAMPPLPSETLTNAE
jgi:hypothetical protein